MKVGELAETITVTGETPLVDVRSADVQKVVTKEIVDAIPTGRLGINLAALQPGIILGARRRRRRGQHQLARRRRMSAARRATRSPTWRSTAASRPNSGRPSAALSAATTIRFGESLSSSPSFTAMQEMSVNTSGADASLAGGGVQINYVPRDGGNTFKGLLFFSRRERLDAGRRTTRPASRDATGVCTPADSLFCRGLTTQPGALKQVYDFNPGLRRSDHQGQAVVLRHGALDEGRELRPEQLSQPELRRRPDQPDAAQHDDADLHARTRARTLGTTLGGGGNFWEQTLRLTWQMTPKNKLGIYYNNKKRDVHQRHHDHLARGAELRRTSSRSPTTWSSGRRRMTNRLLLEAGFWRHQETWGKHAGPTATSSDPLAVGVTDNNPQTLVPGYTQLIQNYHGRVGATDTPSHNPNYRGNFAVSYVTGSHSFKTGFDLNGASRWANSALRRPVQLRA